MVFIIDPTKDPYFQLALLGGDFKNVGLPTSGFTTPEEKDAYAARMLVCMTEIENQRLFYQIQHPALSVNSVYNRHIIDEMRPIQGLKDNRTKGKALIIGNGPSIYRRIMATSEVLQDYETFVCFHACYKLPFAPDFVIHIDPRMPRDKPEEELWNFPWQECEYIMTPTTAYQFVEKVQTQSCYVYYNPETHLDVLVAQANKQPIAPPAGSTVITTMLQSAVIAGHTDITLIGVDLKNDDDVELPQATHYADALEMFPKWYPDITWRNASRSNLIGFEKV